MALGKKQLQILRSLGVSRAFVVPSADTMRLCALGLMKAHGRDGSIVAITPDGLRALADAAERGRIALFEMPLRPAQPAARGSGGGA